MLLEKDGRLRSRKGNSLELLDAGWLRR